jgi:hypothetical protein
MWERDAEMVLGAATELTVVLHQSPHREGQLSHVEAALDAETE